MAPSHDAASREVRGGWSAYGLTCEWQQFRVCINPDCGAKCADVHAPSCPTCGAPWYPSMLAAWRERQARPWWRRLLSV